MAAKKKRESSNNRAKTTQPRSSRLLKGKTWISSYAGKNIVRGYAKHFRVDLLCAIKELRLLGIMISELYEQSVQQTLAAQASQKKFTEEQKTSFTAEGMSDSDDDFVFIIGYTSGGVPYGVRWEDMPPDEEDPN